MSKINTDKAAFKVEALTEGGYVTYAPGYSQYSESLDLASKRLVIRAEQWAKDVAYQLKLDAKEELEPVKDMRGKPPTIING